ncbi:hypothetical protein PZS07_21845 [Providencia thailandensis]|uniref:Uncharacterized protein n=1 Tax=Providencia stuartii TaxID=588 RepID=A0AAJ1JIM4_PROST|nr:hypothetical protein [Providencia thailandensis]MDE5307275.1 hypothetical protein [Providencia stuartii]MDE5308980.1 hypothetical protein [Providencia stuartii]MDE8752793.1 hypothetical protein [Providencia thailandensis]MDE8772041.1 hypothetical protein [Providencia thailandensis]MDE8776341.1 hypothetical protein [Providencia thailandensis]
MDKSRQQFEEWFAPQKEEMKRNGLGMISITRMHRRQLSAWQASRESLINNLEPVGYITPVSGLLLRRKQKSFIYPEKTEANIPLYRLD